jgi:hypothetical protein
MWLVAMVMRSMMPASRPCQTEAGGTGFWRGWCPLRSPPSAWHRGSAEVTRKRKADDGVRTAGKWVKIAGKKNVVSALKPGAASKAAKAPKAAAASKPAMVPNPAAAKASAPAASKVAADAGLLNAAVAGRKGVGVLKISTGTKRPAGTELPLAEATMRSKAAKASSPAHGAGDERVELCSMLGVASTTSSSSSSSDSSAPASTGAPEPNPDASISSAVVVSGLELPVISEVPELEATQGDLEHVRAELEALHGAGESAGM